MRFTARVTSKEFIAPCARAELTTPVAVFPPIFFRRGSPWLQHSPHRVWAREERRPDDVEKKVQILITGPFPVWSRSLELAYGQGGRPRWREQALCKKPAAPHPSGVGPEQQAQRHSPRNEGETVSQGLFEHWVDRDGSRVRRPIGSERGVRRAPRLGNQAPSTGPSP